MEKTFFRIQFNVIKNYFVFYLLNVVKGMCFLRDKIFQVNNLLVPAYQLKHNRLGKCLDIFSLLFYPYCHLVISQHCRCDLDLNGSLRDVSTVLVNSRASLPFRGMQTREKWSDYSTRSCEFHAFSFIWSQTASKHAFWEISLDHGRKDEWIRWFST